jgi:hypothetical protein
VNTLALTILLWLGSLAAGFLGALTGLGIVLCILLFSLSGFWQG